MVENTQQSEQLFANFLEPRKVMVADAYGASRSGLAKIIISLGAKSKNLILIDNFEDALELVKTVQPEILIVDYGIGKNRGLILSMETKNYKKLDDKIFLLVTSNSSQSTVAQAAEEDVDVFLLKPYSLKSLTEILVSTALAKIYPSDYLKVINVGKKFLDDNNPDAAIIEFDKAAKLNEKPTLAFYYRAQAEQLKELMAQAEKSYNVGLKVNNLHYKCLTGFFDLLMTQKRTVDAYSVVKQISNFFPAHPKRLGQVLSLAVKTGNFSDIERYYESFKEIETRNDELVRYICAALVVCGKHFFRVGNPEKAMEFLKKASVTAAGGGLILKEVVAVLVENNLISEAQEVLGRFPEKSKKEFNYRVAEFLVNNFLEAEKQKLIPGLRAMVREKIKEPVIWYWLIVHLLSIEKIEEAEAVCAEAVVLWPENSNYFNGPFNYED